MERLADSEIGPVGLSMVIGSLVFLLVGIAWPQGAGAVLRIMLATMAVGLVAATAYESMLLVRARHAVKTPFDGTVPTTSLSATPHVLRNLMADLGAADHAQRAQRTSVPWSVRQTLLADARHRLAERHGLDLTDPADHGAIRALVEARTWKFLDGTAPVSELAGILDDLERL